MTLKSDILDGAEIIQDGNSIARTRVFYVSNLSASNGSSILPLALAASGIPLIGDADPDIGGLYVRQRRVKPGVGEDDATVLVIYKSPDGTFGSQSQIEVGTTTSETLSDQDKDGNPIVITYTNGAGVTFPALAGRVPTLRSRSTLTITRVETSAPDVTSRQYSGYTNSSTWKGQAAYTWRCTGIVGRSTDGGATYVVTYSFEFRVEGWTETLVYPDVVLTSGDISGSNGARTYLPLPTADFDGLGV